MITEEINTRQLFAALGDTASELKQLASSLTEKQINTIPFADSWTAGQLIEHVTKSGFFIAKALHAKGETPARAPDKRAQELKAMFLDFTVKFKSPGFVLPTSGTYEKETLIDALKRSIEELTVAGNKASLPEAITDPALGELTKLELLYLALYHMQRHIRQLKNIMQQ